MSFRVIAISGPVASGKTSLATGLEARFTDVVVLKTHELIRAAQPSVEFERSALQAAGSRLDARTRGRWLGQAIAKAVLNLRHEPAHVVVDSCRIEGQVDGLRRLFGNRVVHVHLTASEGELGRRYARRQSKMRELDSYALVRADPTEAKVDDLVQIADIVVDTERCDDEDVLVRTAAKLGLYGRSYSRLVDVLIGGQWGSEGKGHVASYLAPEYGVLVRVGGPNAGHKVYREAGALTYHHLPSGTQENDSAKVVIGPGAVIRVPDLLSEIVDSGRTSASLFIDPNAMVIEDVDIEREEEGNANKEGMSAIGSTRRGVGEATARKVLRPRATPRVRLASDVHEIGEYLRPTVDVLDDAFRVGQRVFLEGTQGTGLSLHHGSYPHVTSRETTVSGCLAEAGIAPGRVRRVVMVVRSYPIRVKGPSGPMGREISWAEVARRSGQSARQLRKLELSSTSRRLRRVAEFNWGQLRKAASLNGPTDIALSFADYIAKTNELARRFDQLNEKTIRFIEEIERVASAPVSLVVTRFRHPERSIIDRRKWGGR
ncbi:MAG: adenylosuccinate synthetase [Bryobacterales bacterium]|nr:adenylosuccinate synthetase [Bryobacterales bacterium]